MPCECKVGCSNHLMNTCFHNEIQTEKSLPEKGFLGREIPGRERFPGQRNLCIGKVTGKRSLPRERFHGQINLCLVKVSEKSFQDCKGG